MHTATVLARRNHLDNTICLAEQERNPLADRKDNVFSSLKWRWGSVLRRVYRR
jgi:hypothetical protein